MSPSDAVFGAVLELADRTPPDEADSLAKVRRQLLGVLAQIDGTAAPD